MPESSAPAPPAPVPAPAPAPVPPVILAPGVPTVLQVSENGVTIQLTVTFSISAGGALSFSMNSSTADSDLPI
jgi:hypothetical protein